MIARALAGLGLLAILVGVAHADCVDPAEQARMLEAKRGRRADERDFTKAGRHEISAFGGYYVSDLFDGTYVVGGMYGYHLTEDVAIDASFGYSQIRSSVASRLEQDRGVSILPAHDRMLLLFADAVWAPFHGKAQLFADTILHFDFYGSLGAGIVDNSTSLGAAGRAGLGVKVFVGQAWAIRLDVYDHLYQQQVLATRQYVQDFTVTLGVSLFLPTSP